MIIANFYMAIAGVCIVIGCFCIGIYFFDIETELFHAEIRNYGMKTGGFCMEVHRFVMKRIIRS